MILPLLITRWLKAGYPEFSGSCLLFILSNILVNICTFSLALSMLQHSHRYDFSDCTTTVLCNINLSVDHYFASIRNHRWIYCNRMIGSCRYASRCNSIGIWSATDTARTVRNLTRLDPADLRLKMPQPVFRSELRFLLKHLSTSSSASANTPSTAFMVKFLLTNYVALYLYILMLLLLLY